MILFGTAYKRGTMMPTYAGECMSCRSATINMTVYHKYFHIFFIPFIPLKKEVRGECRTCGRKYEADDLPTYFDETVKALKKAVRTPPVHFVGLVLFLLFGAFTSYRESVAAKDAEAYLANPKVADRYVLPLGIRSSFKYVICRVEAVWPDSLTFSVGHDAYAFQKGAREALDDGKLDKEGYFEGDLTLARKEVAELLKDEDIKPIARPDE